MELQNASEVDTSGDHDGGDDCRGLDGRIEHQQVEYLKNKRVQGK